MVKPLEALRLMEIKELMSKLRKESAYLQDKIIKDLQDRSVYINKADGIEIAYKESQRNVLDSKALKIDEPTIYKNYSKVTKVKSLTIKKV